MRWNTYHTETNPKKRLKFYHKKDDNKSYRLFYGGAKEAKLELLVSNLIAKFKTPQVIAVFFELNMFLKQNLVA